ncbi:DnaJ subfamily C member 25 [Trichostrongylus colubriformis]|uniref:DnaJ subfamily C member 25 n=1 Tax=Trichostrongylus colubriformis TaxID=6319 RepID=A0AAN8FWW2_TRICO
MGPFFSSGWTYLLIFLYLCEPVLTVGFAEELYCGLENCYDVLEINRDEFDKAKLAKIYRSLAKKYHPDRVKDQAAKAEAEARFRVIATAYETLKDDQARSDYDYYLDHPEERFYNYYQYYRRRMVPKVDVRLVILGTILSISLFQYFSAKQKYSEAISYAMTAGKFRNMAINTGVERGVLEVDSKGKLKRIKGQNNEDIIRSIIEENMDVRGGYKKESVYDTLAWHCISFPYVAVIYLWWYAKWVVKYWIKREEYDEEAKLHLIRKYLGMSLNQFNCMTEYEHEDMLARELWVQENFKRWKADRDAEEQERLVQSGRYKRYKRYMKNAGTISFVDED